MRDQIVADALDVMPVDRLRDLIRGKATFAPLIDAGLETVGKVLAAGAEALRRIPRVRRRMARRVMAAASQVRESVENGTRFASTRTLGLLSKARSSPRCAATSAPGPR